MDAGLRGVASVRARLGMLLVGYPSMIEPGWIARRIINCAPVGKPGDRRVIRCRPGND